LALKLLDAKAEGGQFFFGRHGSLIAKKKITILQAAPCAGFKVKTRCKS
jgi:hypothetical protein